MSNAKYFGSHRWFKKYPGEPQCLKGNEAVLVPPSIFEADKKNNLTPH